MKHRTGKFVDLIVFFLKQFEKKQPKFRFVTLAFLWRINQNKHLVINLHVLHDYSWVMPASKKLCSGANMLETWRKTEIPINKATLCHVTNEIE